MGDSGKLWFYEPDHESEMLLLKTHSHTSNVLAMEPGTREKVRSKEMHTLQQGKPPVKHLLLTAGVTGGGKNRHHSKPTTKKVLGRGALLR